MGRNPYANAARGRYRTRRNTRSEFVACYGMFCTAWKQCLRALRQTPPVSWKFGWHATCTCSAAREDFCLMDLQSALEDLTSVDHRATALLRREHEVILSAFRQFRDAGRGTRDTRETIA